MAGLHGLDPLTIAHADPLQRDLAIDITQRALELRAELDRALAQTVVAELAKAIDRGKRKS